MANRRYPFQGQFGVHETSLTTVIGYGEFKAAEQIIESTNDPTFLNDGRYENIPLHMVLTNNHYNDRCRNLKLARLLVQKGASPNLRIPYGDMSESSPSPFEELVVYYEVLKAYAAGEFDALSEELEMYFENEEAKVAFLTNTVDLDNTKCLPNIEDIRKLIEQTSELIDIFLYYGSDPSVLTTFAHKSLFHWVVEHEDVALAKRFLDTSRVNLNLTDVHGSSPLMDAILRNKPENALVLYETMCETTETVELNCVDCCGETALFRAVFAGATELANRLCKDGAKLTTSVCLSQVPISTCEEPRPHEGLLFSILTSDPNPMATPLLAPLLADSPVRMRYDQVSTNECIAKVGQPHKNLADKIILAGVSPLIDMGCFNNQTVALEMMELLNQTDFQSLQSADINPTDLLTLMFGQVSTGLRQLCVRSIFDRCSTFSQVTDKSWLKAVPHVFCLPWCCDRGITPDKIKVLMERLGLPPSLKIFFDIDAAKYQLCSLIMSHVSMECDQACSGSDDDSIFDDEDDESYGSDFSSVYADSDSLLFFSSDISDESSEEVDDLSEEDSSSHEEGEREDSEDGVKGDSEEGEKEDSEEGVKEEGAVGKAKSGLKKIKYDQEDSTSESEDVRVVVETFCEDLAEDVAQERPAISCDTYQRLADESTTTTESPENLTASDSVSDSLC